MQKRTTDDCDRRTEITMRRSLCSFGAALTERINLPYNKAESLEKLSGSRFARQRVMTDDPSDLDFCMRMEEMALDADGVAVFGGTNGFGHGQAPLGMPSSPGASGGAWSSCERLEPPEQHGGTPVMKRKLGLLLLLAALGSLLSAHALAACEGDHPFGPWKTKRVATCHAAGLAFRYCRKCDHWEQKDLPRPPHTPGEWTVILEPTCTHHGREETYCTVCGDRMRRTTPALPHTDGDMTVEKQATCTADGRGTSICSVCGHKTVETIPRLGHDLGSLVITREPTCKKDGLGEEPCLRCGKAEKVTIPHLEHEFSEWVVVNEPNGRKKGLREHVCVRCGEKKQEHFYLEGTLYEGMTPNEDVIHLQEKLRDLGFYNGSIRTGTFGEKTTQAVTSFQKKHGLNASGIADSETLERLETEWSKLGGRKKENAPANKK